ncbi:hypothetical protein NPIL_696741 [Nephila pilipes]|uniref:Uncharacterized protein n=1 Tax=Nephila pilipes TaxID=299642 RepID=A0A8X6NUF6_NEPPI|nr:hypothetical protein NPIL_696741 [Nephila pilipes]
MDSTELITSCSLSEVRTEHEIVLQSDRHQPQLEGRSVPQPVTDIEQLRLNDECSEYIVMRYGNRKLLQKVNCKIRRRQRKICYLKEYGFPKEILYRTKEGETHKYEYAGKIPK